LSSVPARLTVVTLGTRDLQTLSDFYTALGWQPDIELDDFRAFGLRGAVVALFPIEQLAAEAGLEPAPPQPGAISRSLAINVDEIEEVDSTLDAARAAGGRITAEPTTMDWGGRSGYFADPEENHWEVAWVPPDTKMAKLLARAVG
jgi:uncharacterized protein